MNLPDSALLAGFPELTDEEKHQRTLAGLADVDAGRTIPDEEVKAWARSLLNQANSTK
jgi:predicted transcriptional regulator